MPLLFRPSSASFPLTTVTTPYPPALPPPHRKRPRPGRGKLPLLPLRKRLARPKRRSRLPSRPNALHMPSRSSTILICLCLAAVSRPRRVWSGTTACVEPLVGLGGSCGFIRPSTCVVYSYHRQRAKIERRRAHYLYRSRD